MYSLGRLHFIPFRVVVIMVVAVKMLNHTLSNNEGQFAVHGLSAVSYSKSGVRQSLCSSFQTSMGRRDCFPNQASKEAQRAIQEERYPSMESWVYQKVGSANSWVYTTVTFFCIYIRYTYI